VDPGEVVFKSRRFSIRRRHRPARDGTVHTHDIVEHPGAAVILPLLDDGRVVLISNYRTALGRELLELPAGTLDPPESPLECARRELTEETGYEAGTLEPLVAFYSTPGICTEHMHVFVARKLQPGPQRLGAGEEIRLEPMEYAQALRAIGEGWIEDAKTMLALLYYDRYTGEKGR
jgi:ADP-ribose pyrophosphatase